MHAITEVECKVEKHPGLLVSSICIYAMHTTSILHDGICTLVACVCLYACLLLAELRAGCVPNHISSWMGCWAAKEYRKFAFPVSPCISHDLLSKEDYQIWFILCQKMEMVFHCGRYV